MKFCPQCGNNLSQGDRFCAQCGYSIPAEEVQHEISNPEIPETNTSGITESEPVTPVLDAHNPEENKKKKFPAFLRISIILLLLGIVVMIGYNLISYQPLEENSSIDSTLMIDESTSGDTVAAALQDNTGTDSVSEAIEITEVKKEKEKPIQPAIKSNKTINAGKNKPVQNQKKESVNEQQNTPKAQEQIVKPAPIEGKEKKIVYSSINKEFPKYKNPKNPARFSVTQKMIITRIITDHYNDNQGTSSAGTITISSKNGTVLGVYKATGKNGSNGTTNGKWIIEPKIVLEPGTYFIQDSDPATWSKSLMGIAFVEVQGYEL